jgi:hypothetical protein
VLTGAISDRRRRRVIDSISDRYIPTLLDAPSAGGEAVAG